MSYVYRGSGRDTFAPDVAAGPSAAELIQERKRAREQLILKLICLGWSTGEIADRLGVAIGTAKTQIKDVYALYPAPRGGYRSQLSTAVNALRVGDVRFKPLKEPLKQITAHQRQLLQHLANCGSASEVERVHDWKRTTQKSSLRSIATRWWGAERPVNQTELVVWAMRAGWVK